MQTTIKVDQLSIWLPITQLSAQIYAGSFFVFCFVFFYHKLVYFKHFVDKSKEKKKIKKIK